MKSIMLKLALCCWALSAVGSWSRSLESHLVRIDVSTAADWHVGPCVVVYTAVNSGMDPASYKWEWRCTCNNWTGDWVLQQQGSASFMEVGESSVGSYEVRCTATYGAPGMGDPDPDSMVTTSITFHGPDNDLVDSGLNTNSSTVDDGVMQLTIVFGVYWGPLRLGCCVDGYAQERIRIAGSEDWSDWKGTPPEFYFDCGQIVDIWKVSIQGEDRAGWDSLGVGDVFTNIYKQNRMVIGDCHGGYQYFEFDPIHLKAKKTGDTTFQVFLSI